MRGIISTLVITKDPRRIELYDIMNQSEENDNLWNLVAGRRSRTKDPEAFYKPAKRPFRHDLSSCFGKDNGGAIPSNMLSIPNTDSNSPAEFT